MALFQEWYLINNINDNIKIVENLLDNKHNNYYYLNEYELEELNEKLNEYNKFNIIIEIKNNQINELKSKINNYNDLHKLFLIISLFISILYYLYMNIYY